MSTTFELPQSSQHCTRSSHGDLGLHTESHIQFLKKTNPLRKSLTIERLRNYSGCEHYDETQATEILELFNQIALVVIELQAHNSITSIDNQCVVNLYEDAVSSLNHINSTQNKAA